MPEDRIPKRERPIRIKKIARARFQRVKARAGIPGSAVIINDRIARLRNLVSTTAKIADITSHFTTTSPLHLSNDAGAI